MAVSDAQAVVVLPELGVDVGDVSPHDVLHERVDGFQSFDFDVCDQGIAAELYLHLLSTGYLSGVSLCVASVSDKSGVSLSVSSVGDESVSGGTPGEVVKCCIGNQYNVSKYRCTKSQYLK